MPLFGECAFQDNWESSPWLVLFSEAVTLALGTVLAAPPPCPSGMPAECEGSSGDTGQRGPDVRSLGLRYWPLTPFPLPIPLHAAPPSSLGTPGGDRVELCPGLTGVACLALGLQQPWWVSVLHGHLHAWQRGPAPEEGCWRAGQLDPSIPAAGAGAVLQVASERGLQADCEFSTYMPLCTGPGSGGGRLFQGKDGGFQMATGVSAAGGRWD